MEFVNPTDRSATSRPAAGAAEGIATISPAELGARRSRGEPAELIDVRTPGEYAAVHAEGARLVPLDRLDPRAVMSARGVQSNEPLYVICHSGSRSAKAVGQFRSAGFDNAVSVRGGTVAWERAGLPVVRGTRKVMPLDRQVRTAIGLVVLLGTLLAWLVHPAFLVVPGFCGAGLIVAGLTDWCGMAMLLARMPWNRGEGGGDGNACTCSPRSLDPMPQNSR